MFFFGKVGEEDSGLVWWEREVGCDGGGGGGEGGLVGGRECCCVRGGGGGYVKGWGVVVLLVL